MISLKNNDFRQRFADALSNDFQIPQATAVMWEMLKSDLAPQEILNLLFDFDQVFGLKLDEVNEEKIPDEIIELAKNRVEYKQKKDFQKADEIRKTISNKGYQIEDLKNDFKIKRI